MKTGNNNTNCGLSLCLLALCLAIASFDAAAQVTVGSENQPEKAALLDLKSDNVNNPLGATDPTNVTSSRGGLVLPRVKLKNPLTMEPFIPTTDPEWVNNGSSRVKEIHAGLVVYNLTSDNNFIPGLYMWDGRIWSASDTTILRAGNGVTQNGDTFRLGGRLIAPLKINTANHSLAVDRSGGGTGNIVVESPADISGVIKYTNGTPGDTKRLVSDANGNASWQSAAPFVTPTGKLLAPTTNTTAASIKGRWRDSKTYIELPPGRWMVMVVMLASIGGSPTATGRVFINSTFVSESAKTSGNPDPNDFIGSGQMVSGAAYGGSNIISGYVVIENRTGKKQKYHYYFGNGTMNHNNMVLSAFASEYWKENCIVAFAMVE